MHSYDFYWPITASLLIIIIFKSKHLFYYLPKQSKLFIILTINGWVILLFLDLLRENFFLEISCNAIDKEQI